MEYHDSEDPVMEIAYKGHKDVVTSLSFHPGLKSLASGSLDSIVHVWNFKSKGKVYRFMGHKGPVNSVDFSPNGTLIASAS